RRVRGFVSTLVRQHADVDEIVQQTCLTAWRKIGEFHRKEDSLANDFVRWLCTIARFEALAFVRKHHGSRLLFDSELVGKLADMQLSRGETLDDRRRALADCIEKLPGSQKDLVRRYYRARESAAVIAKQEGVTSQAIFKRLRGIRVALLDCVGRTMRANEIA
ncbi:MAG: sigma-70 family RNA polymerase sigma factor, partial [Planctomycetales bacterium]|nr:sigma-70 family RNA polymerase sigma factor [Planctomycetales bacterium]